MFMKNLTSHGFTLVEILVVMAIVAIIGTILVAIFTNTLRGSNKSQILAVIKQNGQAVLENMDKTIRGADNVVCPKQTGSPSDTLVIVKNGLYTRFRIIAQSSANGFIQQDSPSPGSDIKLFIDNVCTDPLTSAVTLTDINDQSGVSVQSGSFTKNTQAGSKDSVNVSFTLGPGTGLPATIKNQIDAVTFQTTVALR